MSASLAEVDAWESGGRDTDEAYARVYLAHHYASEAAEKDSSLQDEGEMDAWQKMRDAHYATALAKVDAMGPEERVDEVRRVIEQEEKEMQEMQEMITKIGSDLSTNGAALAVGTGIVLGAAFLAMFGPLDILFTLLALGAAYKFAAGFD